MIPVSDVRVKPVMSDGTVSLRDCAAAEALMELEEMDAALVHDDGDEYTMYSVMPQTMYPDPEKAAMVSEELDRLKAVLRTRWRWLTARERDVMSLSMRDPGRPLREMAAELGISFQAVGWHLNNARCVLLGGDRLLERVERARGRASRTYRTPESRREYMKEYQRRRRAEGRAK